jgi:hypothetical protein
MRRRSEFGEDESGEHKWPEKLLIMYQFFCSSSTLRTNAPNFLDNRHHVILSQRVV